MTLLDERPEATKKCSICEHDAHQRGKCSARSSALLGGHCDCWFEEPEEQELEPA